MDMNLNGDWSNLPEGVLSEISKKYNNSYIDNLRLRSVCSSWRSLLPHFHKNLSFPLQLPVPIFPGDRINVGRGGFFSFSKNTVYLLQQLSTSSSDQTPTTCLIKVAEKNSGKFVLLHPLAKNPIEGVPENIPKIINLMDFHVFEISNAYNLDYHFTDSVSVPVPSPYDLRYDLFFDRVVLSQMGSRILAINGHEDLYSLKFGDQVWTMIHFESHHYFKDIINYKGKFYAVDSDMVVLVFDESSLERIRVIESPLMGTSISFLSRQHLVESSGDLFLILQVNTKEFFHLEIKIFKMQGSGFTWESVDDLGDRALFLGFDSNYSISAPHSTFKENSLYFAMLMPSFMKDQTFVFNLKDESLTPISLSNNPIF